MPRPISPVVFIAIFLAVVIAAVLMFAIVLQNNGETESSTPKAAIALQLALLEKGDAVGLRLTVTERLREQITPALVEKARPVYRELGLDDLVGRVDVKDLEDGGREAVVTTAEGRELTRLVLVEGDWLADTVWFW